MKNAKEWMEVSDGWKDLYEKAEEERNSLFVKVEDLRQKIRDLEKEQVQHIDILADQFAKQNADLKAKLAKTRQETLEEVHQAMIDEFNSVRHMHIDPILKVLKKLEAEREGETTKRKQHQVFE